MSEEAKAAGTLYKQRSWSPDTFRDEAWRRRKECFRRRRRIRSVTDDDLEELKGCIELGFGFDSGSPVLDRKLSDTLPALDFFHAVNQQYNHSIPLRTASEASAASDPDSDAPASPRSIFGPGDDPLVVKARLKQWAQVVACSVRQSC